MNDKYHMISIIQTELYACLQMSFKSFTYYYLSI